MELKIPSQLIESISSRRCALFAGSGLTANCGGTTWNELINALKTRYGYDSPLDDNFLILGDMKKKYGRHQVYNDVRELLKQAKIEGPIKELAALPWFSTFTTNYDTALEDALRDQQGLSVWTVLTGLEYQLSGLPAEMMCVKLMGSLDIEDGQPGHMVLDRADLEVAREERARVLDILATHAARLNFLFVGYSFNDSIFLDILAKLTQRIGVPEGRYFAVFRNQPDEKVLYTLQQYGITPIISDLVEFSTTLTENIALRDPRDLTKKKIQIGSEIIALNPSKATSIFSQFDPVLYETMGLPIEPLMFFRGNTESLLPFTDKWHYERPETQKAIDEVLKANLEKPRIITIYGPPGSGRTFTILAAINRLIIENKALAIKISETAFTPFPTSDELKPFLDEVMDSCSKSHVPCPERLVFFAEHVLDTSDISKFERMCSEIKFPVSLIYEDCEAKYSDEELKLRKRLSVPVYVEITSTQKSDLSDYLVRTIDRLHLPKISHDEAERVIEREKTLLAILYTTIDPSKRSIDNIVEQDLGKLSDKAVRACIFLCAAAQCQEIPVPIGIMKKAVALEAGHDINFENIYSIIEGPAKPFIYLSQDSRGNDTVVTYHQLVAVHIAEMVRQDKLGDLLASLVESADIKSKNEAEFVGELLITKGVNLESSMPRQYDIKGLEGAILRVVNRQPARPMLHHLARLYMKVNVSDSRIVPLLERALEEPREVYALNERRENVLTTLAKVTWEQNRDRWITKKRDDSDIRKIMSLLAEARMNVPMYPHAYDYQARILKELAMFKSEEEKYELITEAVDILNDGILYCQDNIEADQQLNGLLIEVLSIMDVKLALDAADDLFNRKGDGAGYYALAQFEYRSKKNEAAANRYLDVALSAKTYPPGAIALKIEILLYNNNYPNYKTLLKLAQGLTASLTWRDNWKSAYNQAVIYVVNGYYEEATGYFEKSRNLVPYLQKKVNLFVMDGGHRKTYYGKITTLYESEGWISSHSLDRWVDNIYFTPSIQQPGLKRGMFVDFEIGFLPRGPIAFDLRPHIARN